MTTPYYKRPLIIGGAIVTYICGATITYLSFYEPPKRYTESLESMTNEKRLKVFNTNASKYDKDVALDENLMLISLMRRFLLRQAKGNVLEVAAGTGRNLPYYTKKNGVKHLTLTDFSSGMLSQINNKQKDDLDMSLQVMSANELQFPNETFDTVVDTFGLCSMDNTNDALLEMQRVCKRDGKILLLEHGRSNHTWLSSILDKFAGLHVERWGCHWNRDILALVTAAGLEIETCHRFHFGTTYYIIAKPKNSLSVLEKE